MKTTRVGHPLSSDALASKPALEQGQPSIRRRGRPEGFLNGLPGTRPGTAHTGEPAASPVRRVITLGGQRPAAGSVQARHSPGPGNGEPLSRPSDAEQGVRRGPRLGPKRDGDKEVASLSARAAIADGVSAAEQKASSPLAPTLRRRIAAGTQPAAQIGADTRSNAAVIAQYQAGKKGAEEVLKVTASLLKMGGDFATSTKLLQAVKDAGVRPSVVSYNAAMSAYDKAGRPDEALKLFAELSDLAKHDPSMLPTVVTYNTAIAACASAGQPDMALSLLGELKDLARRAPSMRPTVVTYTSAISACGKANRFAEATALMTELKQQAIGDPTMRPNRITYNVAISACAKAGQARDALELLGELKRLSTGDPSMRPDTITYNAAISACGKGGLPREALALLEELKGIGERDPCERSLQSRTGRHAYRRHPNDCSRHRRECLEARRR